jgi:hypothetical protein
MAYTALDESGNLLTTDQVLDRLFSDVRLRSVALTCVLPAVRSEGKWRFRRADLEEWIERQHQLSSPRDVT